MNKVKKKTKGGGKDIKPKLHPPKHPLPPHLERELNVLREKVARLEGKVDVLLKIFEVQKRR